MTSLKQLVVSNADEEVWLPDLIQEFIVIDSSIPKFEAISLLTEGISKIVQNGSIGIYSFIPSDASDHGEEVCINELPQILSDKNNWEYGKVTKITYALFNKDQIANKSRHATTTRHCV